jgi:DNA-binding transcriptional regulator YiaG
VADDFREQMDQTIETHNEDRRRRGETDRAVRVTNDRPTYEKAMEDRGEAANGVGLAELRERLYGARKDRCLSQADVGRVFEVSQSIVASWERGPERRGKAIPENIRPLVLRWILKGEGPTEDELKALAARRRGSRKGASLEPPIAPSGGV